VGDEDGKIGGNRRDCRQSGAEPAGAQASSAGQNSPRYVLASDRYASMQIDMRKNSEAARVPDPPVDGGGWRRIG